MIFPYYSRRSGLIQRATVKPLFWVAKKPKYYEVSLVRRLIKQVTVYDDLFTVEFKSSIEIGV